MKQKKHKHVQELVMTSNTVATTGSFLVNKYFYEFFYRLYMTHLLILFPASCMWCVVYVLVCTCCKLLILFICLLLEAHTTSMFFLAISSSLSAHVTQCTQIVKDKITFVPMICFI